MGWNPVVVPLVFLLNLGCKSRLSESIALVASSSQEAIVSSDSPARKMIGVLATDAGGVFCTATFLAPKAALTAVHCFHGSDDDDPVTSIATAPAANPDGASFVFWNGGKDMANRSDFNMLAFKTRVVAVHIHPETQPGALGIVPPKPDLAVICLKDALPKATLTADVASFDGEFTRQTLVRQSFRYYGFGARSPDNAGVGVLRQGRGIGFDDVRWESATDPIQIVENPTWLEKLNPFRTPDSGCRGDSGGPVFIETSGTLAGVISSGQCSELFGRERRSGLQFSPIDRIGKNDQWLINAVRLCD